MDALITLIETLPGAGILRSVLADHIARPSRESWRLVVVGVFIGILAERRAAGESFTAVWEALAEVSGGAHLVPDWDLSERLTRLGFAGRRLG